MRPELPNDWRSMTQVLDWVRRNTPASAVLSGNLDPTYFLFTGRKAVRAFEPDPLIYYRNLQPSDRPVGSAETLRMRLALTKTDYLIITPDASFIQMPFIRANAHELARSGGLVPIDAPFDPGYEVYRVMK